MTDVSSIDEFARNGVNRRTVLRGAAWTVPVIALAVAAPVAAAASTTDASAYALNGSCGTPGILGPGFTLTASPTAPLPVGTTVVISGTGVANIGVFSATPSGFATQTRLSATSTQFTLTAEVAAGATIAMRTTLSTSVRWTLRATTTLPEGYIGTGAKTDATVTSALTGCSTA
ncbi:hypothetical protein [Microbacterium sp. SLBN-111]|uniref:hypothetical protein n=1 Tax=Microbacterium sp. SLBN-111 TaxID=3377733 RepID=UPI003C73A329